MDDITVDEFSKRLEAAAVEFARDHGPLHAATNGDPAARAKVADRLGAALLRNGLTANPR
jgi:hypothetical protein